MIGLSLVLAPLAAAAPPPSLEGRLRAVLHDAGFTGTVGSSIEQRLGRPIDRFARGDASALSVPQKEGALVFFGAGRCTSCHAVAGASNEMFSDFEMHVIGVPQIAPLFGVGTGNVIFDGPGEDEDYGLEQLTGNPADRYKFRSSPLRNVAVQAAFFHDGAFTRLEDAIRHHLDVFESARGYDPVAAGVDPDLTRLGPIEPILARVDPLLASPITLSAREFENLVAFVRGGLLDERATRQNLCGLIPDSLPSGYPTMRFEQCPQPRSAVPSARSEGSAVDGARPIEGPR